jgi:hypothetical protein
MIQLLALSLDSTGVFLSRLFFSLIYKEELINSSLPFTLGESSQLAVLSNRFSSSFYSCMGDLFINNVKPSLVIGSTTFFTTNAYFIFQIVMDQRSIKYKNYKNVDKMKTRQFGRDDELRLTYKKRNMSSSYYLNEK